MPRPAARAPCTADTDCPKSHNWAINAEPRPSRTSRTLSGFKSLPQRKVHGTTEANRGHSSHSSRREVRREHNLEVLVVEVGVRNHLPPQSCRCTFTPRPHPHPHIHAYAWAYAWAHSYRTHCDLTTVADVPMDDPMPFHVQGVQGTRNLVSPAHHYVHPLGIANV